MDNELKELLRDILTDLNVRAEWARTFHPEEAVRAHYRNRDGETEIPISRGLIDRAEKLLGDSQTQSDHGIPK